MRSKRALADVGDQPGTDRIAIAPAPWSLDDQIASPARRFVPEHDARAVMMDDDEVEVAVDVEIAAGQSAAHVELLEVGAGACGDIGESAIARDFARGSAGSRIDRAAIGSRRIWPLVASRSRWPSRSRSARTMPQPVSGRLSTARPASLRLVLIEDPAFRSAAGAPESRVLAEEVADQDVGQSRRRRCRRRRFPCWPRPVPGR